MLESFTLTDPAGTKAQRGHGWLMVPRDMCHHPSHCAGSQGPAKDSKAHTVPWPQALRGSSEGLRVVHAALLPLARQQDNAQGCVDPDQEWTHPSNHLHTPGNGTIQANLIAALWNLQFPAYRCWVSIWGTDSGALLGTKMRKKGFRELWAGADANRCLQVLQTQMKEMRIVQGAKTGGQRVTRSPPGRDGTTAPGGDWRVVLAAHGSNALCSDGNLHCFLISGHFLSKTTCFCQKSKSKATQKWLFLLGHF